jgi:excisionase family DNA binding protein
MKKSEVALYLGKSLRTVERFTSQGKLGARYRHGSNGDEAVYDEAEVKRFKEDLELGSAMVRPSVVRDTLATTTDMAGVKTSGVAGLMVAGDFTERLLDALKSLKPVSSSAVPVADKLTLSLVEAAALAGFSRGFLREAIRTKKLKAAKRGRGWNVKRSDLDAFVSKL